MNYLKILLPIILVVVIGYLYSCNMDDPITTKKNIRMDSLFPECPIPEGCNGTHMCLNMFTKEGVNVSYQVTHVNVWVTGIDCNSNNYLCNYLKDGPTTGYGLGSRLPIGATITRTACVWLDNKWQTGTQTFIVPNTEDEINEADYYFILSNDVPCER